MTSLHARHAVVTGMGAVSPLGVGVAEFRRGLREGRSGVGLLDFIEPRMVSSVAARCGSFDPRSVVDSADQARLPRLVPMALAAAREAMTQAALDPESSLSLSRSVGVILGTGAGGIDFTLDQAHTAYATDKRTSLWTITNATHGNLAGELSIRLGLRGPSLCVSTGCASSSDALGLALDLLRSDRVGTPEAFVVVGADAHVRWETLAGMELLKVISTRDWRADPGRAHTASRPFDATRDGFVLGEGAWAVVVERPAFRASREGPEPEGEVLGYGSTCDAYHRVRPEPDATESARAMALAMEDAALAPERVEMVHYHGTATKLNDAQETAAVRIAFGRHAESLIGTSVKSMVGHPQGACGLAAVVASLASLACDHPFVPPTINLHEPDPACDLDYTPNEARPTDARTVLVNCLAFGGKNSALVIRGVR